MDAIITLEGVMGFLKNPPLLAPRPDFNRLRALRKHIVNALRQLTCPQSAIHGWSGLAITPAMYLLLKLLPFAEPVDPGSTVVHTQFSPPATIKMIDAAFTRDKNYYLTFKNISRACFKMLDDSISNQFKVSNTPYLTGWNSTMMILVILDQLKASYGKPDRMTLLATTLCFEALSQQMRPQRCYSTGSNSAKKSKSWHKILIPRSRLSTTWYACCSSRASSPSRSSTLGMQSPPRHTPHSKRLSRRHTPNA